MRLLITGARAPVALELARAFGRAGHTVVAGDSLPATLAGASRFAAATALLPPPRCEPGLFVAAVLAAIERHAIDMILPTCEEVFYLAAGHSALAARTRMFCPPLPALAPLHHKGALQRRAAQLGIPTPRTALLESPDALRAALPAFPQYVLKPVFSRFAARVITNCGPFAGRRPLGSCAPSRADPWLIQAFVAGEALCSYSVLHDGHVTAHCAYTTPLTAGLGSGTAFLSADGGPSLEVARALGAGLTGQLSLDFIRTAAGEHVLLECNPRATSGAHLLDPARLVAAFLDPAAPTWIEPPGRRRQLALAALPAALGGALRRPRAVARRRLLVAAARTPDVIFAHDDPWPALAQLPQMLGFLGLSLRKGIGPLAATTDDIEWNGDAALLTRDY